MKAHQHLAVLLIIVAPCDAALSAAAATSRSLLPASKAACTQQPQLQYPQQQQPQRRRTRTAVCSILGGLAGAMGKDGPAIKTGDRVRVVRSAKLMHVPGHKEGFDPKESVGTVQRVYEAGKTLSANRPIKVVFEEPKKWTGHFDRHELMLAKE